MLKIALVNADNGNGGASRATRRIAKGITSIGGELNFEITFFTEGNPEAGYELKQPSYKWFIKYLYKDNLRKYIVKKIINKVWNILNIKRGNNENYFFREGYSLDSINTFKDFDLIHIFWGQKIISPSAISNLNIPIIVTLHDMWFITGGFAYTKNPQKEKNEFLTWIGKNNYEHQLQSKKILFSKDKNYISVTSEWMKKKVIESNIYNKEIKKIDNYIPENYKYLNAKFDCRELLGWDRKLIQKKIIYFSGSLTNKRKGFDFLLKSIKDLDERIKSLFAIQILGNKQNKIDKLEEFGINYHCLGYFSDEVSQIIAYNAADVLICPSNFDNSPNVIAEAQMCGLPVITLNGSGCSEMIENNFTGIIASKDDFKDLKVKIKDFIVENIKFNNLDIEEWANKKYGLENTCKKYVDFYRTLI